MSKGGCTSRSYVGKRARVGKEGATSGKPSMLDDAAFEAGVAMSVSGIGLGFHTAQVISLDNGRG